MQDTTDNTFTANSIRLNPREWLVALGVFVVIVLDHNIIVVAKLFYHLKYFVLLLYLKTSHNPKYHLQLTPQML